MVGTALGLGEREVEAMIIASTFLLCRRRPRSPVLEDGEDKGELASTISTISRAVKEGDRAREEDDDDSDPEREVWNAIRPREDRRDMFLSTLLAEED